ncbi:hypothetical protein [Cohnella sp.]|uniref:hypothetical protein n=1 Tax=Cohnella sp. TaxID=1883426 RepID=UPI00356AF5B6
MPEITPYIRLKKPLASETADISVINDNMDMIDSALGDLSAVPTTAKTAAGAITELHEAIQGIDVDIPDGSITPAKLSFDPATQTELDAHVNATNVHGATNSATASRLIIRDAAGRAKVAAPAASDDIARLDSITKAQAGLGSVDNYGTATQSEAEAGTATNKFMTPQRTKQAIDKFTGGVPLRINAGHLEYNDGTGWIEVGASYPDWLSQLDIFNNGVDGDYNPSSNASLASKIHRFSSLNIPAGVTISPVGSYLIILVEGTATINGTLSASGKGGNGGSGSSGAGGNGSGGTAGRSPGGGGGGAGTVGTNGGAGGGGTGFGGAGGFTSPLTHATGGTGIDATLVNQNSLLSDIAGFRGGGGGGGGGWPANNYIGGGGGAGGGAIVLIAKSIAGAGAIRADGLNGNLPPAGASTYAGSGGGGAGGLVVVSGGSITPTISVTPGVAGSAGSTLPSGVAQAAAGATGFVLRIIR